MERLAVFVVSMLVLGIVTAAGVWWVAGSRKLFRARQFDALNKRRDGLRRAAGYVLVVLLIVAAVAGVAYVQSGALYGG